MRQRYPSTSIMANRGSGATAAKVKDAAEIERALLPLRRPRFDQDRLPEQVIDPERIEILMLRVKYKIPTDCRGDRVPADDDAATDDDDFLF